MRCTGVFRILLVGTIMLLAWYTVHLYAQLYDRLQIEPPVEEKKDAPASIVEHKNGEKIKVEVEDPDKLIDKESIKKAEEEWDKRQQENPVVKKKMQKNPCTVSMGCSKSEVSFKIITGAANVIGPSVCLNESILMKNSLNNVDRGMNVAVIDGNTGKSTKQLVFDLYGKDSTELKNFLKALKPNEVIMVTTYDDAAFKLDNEAKAMLEEIGSHQAAKLSFRDNWIFVGGKNIKHRNAFEQIATNDKEKNKYGDWPEAIVLEGCLPLLS
uniref:Protein FAM3D n=1 Tax=Phallusia mammillata TaxID=59560 RepID=A0A6F9DDA5_9ASCI|nr:protein FAM3D [Phallusia mammillata]